MIAAADHRGESIGEALLVAGVTHPELQSLEGLSLLCRRGMVEFYESAGFERLDPEIEIPDGGTEQLVRTVYRRND